jgi:hypothetical protein
MNKLIYHRNGSRLAGVALFVFSLSAAGFTCAAPLPDGGMTVDEVADIMRASGYLAKIGKDTGGDPMIESGAEGAHFQVFFYACDKSVRCSSIQLQASYHVTGGMKLAQVNGWNQKWRYGRAYLDNENDPILDMDLDVKHGATTEAISTNIGMWDTILGTFKEMVDCNSEPANGPCKAQFPQ